MAYCNNTDVKTYLEIEKADDDTLLTSLIARAQAAIDSYCHRTFEAENDTTRNFDALEDVDGDTLYLDEDLCGITTVTNGDSDSTVVTSSQYVTQPRNSTPYYAIKIRSDANVTWEYDDYHEGAISIAGKWAYSETAPADVVQACVRLAAWMYKQRDSAGHDADKVVRSEAGFILTPGSLPKDVMTLLAPYKRL